MRVRKELTSRQQRMIGIAAIAALFLFAALVGWRVGVPMLRFASEPEKFRLWVEQNGVFGKLAYAGMVFLQVIVALIPGEPLEIAGGYAFGAVEGTLLCMGAGALGSMAVFFLVRRFGVRLVEIFFSREQMKKLRFLQNSSRRDALFLLVFMIPGTPKDLLCYFAGLTDMRPIPWLLICSLGRLPSIVTSTVGGDALGTKSYMLAVAVFAVTMALSIAGIVAFQKIQLWHARRHEKRAAPKKC